jgi:hypothetical protein
MVSLFSSSGLGLAGLRRCTSYMLSIDGRRTGRVKLRGSILFFYQRCRHAPKSEIASTASTPRPYLVTQLPDYQMVMV